MHSTRDLVGPPLYLSNAQDCWHYWGARMGSHKVKMELDIEKRERIRVP